MNDQNPYSPGPPSGPPRGGPGGPGYGGPPQGGPAGPPPAGWGAASPPGHVTPGGGYPSNGYPPAPPSANGLAVASMVLGILAIVFCWCWFLGIPLGLVGLPLGGVALSKINSGQVPPTSRGQAVAGVTMSIIGLALAIVILIVASNPSWWID